MPSVIKRPVRLYGNGTVVVDLDGTTVCDVILGDLDMERQIAAEIVEALNAYEIIQQSTNACCFQDNGTATLTPEP